MCIRDSACGDAGISYSQMFMLEENDAAYTFALPESVIQFDNVPMPDNVRKERLPMEVETVEPEVPTDPFQPQS